MYRLLVCGLLVLVGCTPGTKEAVEVAVAFEKAIDSDDFQAAYELLCEEDKAALSYEDWKEKSSKQTTYYTGQGDDHESVSHLKLQLLNLPPTDYIVDQESVKMLDNGKVLVEVNVREPSTSVLYVLTGLKPESAAWRVLVADIQQKILNHPKDPLKLEVSTEGRAVELVLDDSRRRWKVSQDWQARNVLVPLYIERMNVLDISIDEILDINKAIQLTNKMLEYENYPDSRYLPKRIDLQTDLKVLEASKAYVENLVVAHTEVSRIRWHRHKLLSLTGGASVKVVIENTGTEEVDGIALEVQFFDGDDEIVHTENAVMTQDISPGETDDWMLFESTSISQEWTGKISAKVKSTLLSSYSNGFPEQLENGTK
jgi:hypothetical protein